MKQITAKQRMITNVNAENKRLKMQIENYGNLMEFCLQKTEFNNKFLREMGEIQ